MRHGQRFTTAKLRRWTKQGRGTGTHQAYAPWHQVTRGDPGSHGRSHVIPSSNVGRQQHLLSDLERTTLHFIAMLPTVIDVREQFPLDLDDHHEEATHYQVGITSSLVPGTLSIAKRLGIRHPMIGMTEDRMPWVMTTDFLVAQRASEGALSLLAVAAKYNPEELPKRKKELLRIEQHYWECSDTPFLIISPETFDQRVATTLAASAPWVVNDDRPLDLSRLQIRKLRDELHGLPQHLALHETRRLLRVELAVAQRVFWQAVWKGLLPVRLANLWRPETPVDILDLRDFWQQNPIASGRTACF